MPGLPYDGNLNFCFPVKNFSSDRVKLVLFDPKIHLGPYFEAQLKWPEIWAHSAFGPYKTKEDLNEDFLENVIHKSPAVVMFVIIDKTKPACSFDSEGAFAGVLTYLNASDRNLVTEVGHIQIFPPFQRTHVNTHACGLLMQYALETKEKGGLGCRRCQWMTSSANQKSQNAAIRLGFLHEGILRWDRVYHDGDARGKPGNGIALAGDREPQNIGRHTYIYGLCWDDWENGGREKLQALMDRR